MKMRQCLNKPIIKWIGGILYAFFIIKLCCYMNLDSDKANHLLQAEDILAGNFFMNNWILTGVTFFTTDLLYYEIGEIFCGITPDAVAIAGGLMLASVFIISYFAGVIGQKKNLKLKSFLFVMLIAIPCYNYILHFRVHTGAAFLCLAVFLMVYCIFSGGNEERRNKIWLVMLFFCCLLGAIGDLLFVIEGIIPILIFCFFKFLGTDDSKEKNILFKIIVIVVLAVLSSHLWDKIYFSIGNADKNSYIEGTLFSSPQEWATKFSSFLQGIMFLSMGDFWHTC